MKEISLLLSKFSPIIMAATGWMLTLGVRACEIIKQIMNKIQLVALKWNHVWKMEFHSRVHERSQISLSNNSQLNFRRF